VKAVLDWELSTLGDPLADLATLTIYWAERTGGGPLTPATALPGFPSRAQLIERYASASGRDVSDLPYYAAFGHWKLACITEGVYTRYAAGAMGDNETAAATMAQSTLQRAAMAKHALAKL
jgi:aminoglycoside phosphotransferase (APT) family kinase protein